MKLFVVIAYLATIWQYATADGILYPRESETREVVSLNGLWHFRTTPDSDPELGFKQQWYSKSLKEWILMPVPSSYNDVTTNATLRDYVGWVWYQRNFFVPKRWQSDQQRVFLRFGSVHFTAVVWVNGKEACKHSGGHLPFKADVTNFLLYGLENQITVAVNNTLTLETVPQGSNHHPNDTSKYPPGYIQHSHEFDFFNYAGIHRPVYLYTTPQVYIDDITILTHIEDGNGIIKYNVEYNMEVSNFYQTTPQASVEVHDHNGVKVAASKGLSGRIIIPEATLWWPYLMKPEAGYLYTLTVRLLADTGEDIYRLPVGIRTLYWNATTFLINNEPIYLRGFGKHEDSDLRGKGLDNVLLIRDYNLIKWLGANAYRTSHYPYAEEILDLADSLGILVIAESPACTIGYFNATLLKNHKAVISEMVQRDKNRPSVIMWSLANEPKTNENASGPYFSALYNYTKALDSTRPVTFVTSQSVHNDKAVQFMDFVCVNRYPAWYSDSGHTELIQWQVVNEITSWHKKFNKPVIVTEYGAGAVVGMHMLPESMWTEDYHVVTLKEHFKAFDILRNSGFFVGEMIWNFADFATPQEYIRPGGCKKGLFTRQRQPKMAAHVTRWRYWSLANTLHNVSVPDDIFRMIL